MPRSKNRGRKRTRSRPFISEVSVSWPNTVVLPDTRDHGNQARQPEHSFETAIPEVMDPISHTGVEDAVPDTNEDNDADVRSEDDRDEDRDYIQKTEITSTTAQPQVTSVHGQSAMQTSLGDYVGSPSQEKKNGKRRAEEDIQPEDKDSTLKKRKALGDMTGSNSRLNRLASTFVPPEAKPANAEGSVPAFLLPPPQKQRAVSASGALRASKSGNNWPRMQNYSEFEAADIADQRVELKSYSKDLFSYVDMIQAGAIPVQFVRSFIRRLHVHLAHIDTTIQKLDILNAQQQYRQAKVHRYCQELLDGQKEIEEAMGELKQNPSADA